MSSIADGRQWPAEMTPELFDILGRPCFMFIKLSQLYRAAGYKIDTQAEAEQAFFLHRFLGFWFEHGEKWQDAANADIEATRQSALKDRDAQGHSK